MKKEMRTRFRSLVASLTPAEIESKSLAAARLLYDTKVYQDAQIMMAFLSLPSEIDTTPIILRAWQDHKRVLAPKISWEQRRMLPVEIHSLTDRSSIPQLGRHEAGAGFPVPVGAIELVLVPGLGFDEHGNRLGRGRGFYDRFLAHPDFRGIACALALEEQVTDTLPVGPHDRPVHLLITDHKIREFRTPEMSLSASAPS